MSELSDEDRDELCGECSECDREVDYCPRWNPGKMNRLGKERSEEKEKEMVYMKDGKQKKAKLKSAREVSDEMRVDAKQMRMEGKTLQEISDSYKEKGYDVSTATVFIWSNKKSKKVYKTKGDSDTVVVARTPARETVVLTGEKAIERAIEVQKGEKAEKKEAKKGSSPGEETGPAAIEDTKRMCPLLSIGNALGSYTSCHEDGCGFWDDQHNCCGVSRIGR